MSEVAEKNSHIPTETIQQDILDTVAEIESLEAMYPGVAVLADRPLRLRVEVGISKRREFIAKLKEILQSRNEQTDCG